MDVLTQFGFKTIDLYKVSFITTQWNRITYETKPVHVTLSFVNKDKAELYVQNNQRHSPILRTVPGVIIRDSILEINDVTDDLELYRPEVEAFIAAESLKE